MTLECVLVFLFDSSFGLETTFGDAEAGSTVSFGGFFPDVRLGLVFLSFSFFDFPTSFDELAICSVDLPRGRDRLARASRTRFFKGNLDLTPG